MSVLTDVSLPASEFGLGRYISRNACEGVTFDRVVSIGSEFTTYLWVITENHDQFKEGFQRESVVEELQLVHLEGEGGLYRVQLDYHSDEFLQCLDAPSVAILHASGGNERWKFELRFDTHDDLRHFQQACQGQDVSVSFDRVVSGSAGGTSDDLLSQTQRETIELALQRGYFDVPRRASMIELAEELGISDQAVSARLRRAMKKLSEQSVIESDQKDGYKSRISRPKQ